MPNSQKQVAFYSMEYAIEENFPIYAGGLGILAADLVHQAGSDNRNMAAFGLFYSKGFYAHFQHEHSVLDPKSVGFSLILEAKDRPRNYSIPIGDHEVWFQTWVKKFGPTTLFLFDTNIPINSGEDQKITERLYPSDHAVALKQQTLLGFGSMKVLASENLQPEIYHLNEGHTSMALLALAIIVHKQNPQLPLEDCVIQAGHKVIATKHTVLTGGGLHLNKEELGKELGSLFAAEKISLDEFFTLGSHETHPNTFSTTNFLLRFAHKSSAVSIAHALAEKKAHRKSELIPITNGINQMRWQAPTSPAAQKVTDLPNQDLWLWHQANKESLLNYLSENFGLKLNKDILTVVWARRFASYKRPELLFSNLDELTKMTNFIPSVQFIIAGQTNPTDVDAQEMIKRILENLKEKNLENRIILLSEYSLSLAKKLTAGADVWLNTPIPGLEASGTSGMKSGINGVLQFTTNDGWAEEVDWDGFGWILPEENISSLLYSILEQNIIPLYYNVDQDKIPASWVQKMRQTMSLIEANYTTKRLLEDYYNKLYFPI